MSRAKYSLVEYLFCCLFVKRNSVTFVLVVFKLSTIIFKTYEKILSHYLGNRSACIKINCSSWYQHWCQDTHELLRIDTTSYCCPVYTHVKNTQIRAKFLLTGKLTYPEWDAFLRLVLLTEYIIEFSMILIFSFIEFREWSIVN